MFKARVLEDCNTPPPYTRTHTHPINLGLGRGVTFRSQAPVVQRIILSFYNVIDLASNQRCFRLSQCQGESNLNAIPYFRFQIFISTNEDRYILE